MAVSAKRMAICDRLQAKPINDINIWLYLLVSMQKKARQS
jgi:hypothetical protein